MSIMHSRFVVAALALLLSSCQSAGPPKQAEPTRSAWQVLERVGRAQVHARGAGDYSEIVVGDQVPAASTLVTGTGGRLILARPGAQIVVGPGSRLRLAQAGREVPLEQTEGRVRYRADGARAAFAVATPALTVQATDTVLEVTVEDAGVEVMVEEGEARVATLDGRSVGVVPAGGSARAGGPHDAALMARGAPGKAYQRVEPVLASNRPPTLEPAAKRSLEAEIGGRATARDAAHAAPLAAAMAGPAKGDGGATAPVPARADGKELVVVPAGFRRAPASDDAVSAPPAGTASDREDARPNATAGPPPENHGTGAPPADTSGDPFVGFADGLLGSLSAASPGGR